MRILVVAIILFASTASIAQTRSSVVSVKAYDEKEDQWYRGTGFFISKDTILTNYHVVNPRIEDNVVVLINNNKIRGLVIFEDRNEDLALVRIKTSGHKHFVLCDTAQVNDDVNILTRNPDYKSKHGTVNYIGFDRIYVIADIEQGNSGSPVVRGNFFNKCVIGVVKSLTVNKTTSVIDFSIVKDFLKRSKNDN